MYDNDVFDLRSIIVYRRSDGRSEDVLPTNWYLLFLLCLKGWTGALSCTEGFWYGGTELDGKVGNGNS